jgi:hypothetical protein
MAMTVFLTVCMLGEGFLVYVLVHFIQEGRRGWADDARNTGATGPTSSTSSAVASLGATTLSTFPIAFVAFFGPNR